MIRAGTFLTACVAALTCFAQVPQGRADSVTFVGSTIALKNITVQSLQSGRLTYLDSNGQRQSRPLEEVQALGFDQFASLDEAEAALSRGESDAGLRSLRKAMLAADSDLRKLWVHARLARIHDLRKEYVLAAGHAAAVMVISADPYWRALEPVCAVDAPSYAAAKEAHDNLQAAKAKVKSSELSASIVRMLKVVGPIYERLSAQYQGPAIAQGETISGVLKSEIAGDGLETPAGKPAVAGATSRASKPTPSTSTKKPDATASTKPAAPVKPEELVSTSDDPRSPAAIDAMLKGDRHREALALCRQIEAQPGDRDLAQFLHQYGLALKGAGEPRDAAVMFMRCAVLYPDGTDAAACLVECAEIYRDEMKNPPAARRLLDRAASLAEALEQPDLADRARAALQSLPQAK